MEDQIKLFFVSNQMVERALDFVERGLILQLDRDASQDQDKDEEYYPQFSQEIRNDAKRMSVHYEIFYCLEISIRTLIDEILKSEFGADWWNTADVPESVRNNVKANMQREMDSGFTLRSDDEIDYTDFGELGEIVRKNWKHFADIFNSEKAFNRVMSNLNLLRGPIAHCSLLAEDEVMRLKLTLRDWFRLME